MSNHRDYDDWGRSPEAQRMYDARSEAEALKFDQRQHANLVKWINEKLEEMDNDQLRLMYDVSYDVEKYKTFFEVLRNFK